MPYFNFIPQYKFINFYEYFPFIYKLPPETLLAAVVPKKIRGKTRMDRFRTRSFDQRIMVGMNEFGQPVVENDGLLSKLSSFLGTLAK